MDEIWKDIEGFGLYQISNLGFVRNMESLLGIAQYKKYSGHHSVTIYDDKGNRKTLNVHRLVALHFLDKVVLKDIVMHIISDPSNNNVNNLKWGTRSENAKQAYNEGALIKMEGMKGKFGLLHHNSKAVIQKSLDGVFIREWESTRQIQREIGFSQANISKCCSGKYKKAYGFTWEFLTI